MGCVVGGWTDHRTTVMAATTATGGGVADGRWTTEVDGGWWTVWAAGRSMHAPVPTKSSPPTLR